MKYLTALYILIFTIWFSFSTYAQSVSKLAKIKITDISRPEKIWAVTHPFSLCKARKISSISLHLADSIRKTNTLDGDANGGQVDAFRHAIWMALLTKHLNSKKARSLGKAHEKGNFLDYKHGRKEDGGLPDKISSDMDLFNNEVGISIIKSDKTLSDSLVIEVVIKNILKGNMKIISKNKQGEFIDCDGNVIPRVELIGKWENRKCLVRSDWVRK